MELKTFWDYVKTGSLSLEDLIKTTFLIHIKECEFRYNHKHDNIYNLLLKNFRNKPLKLS